MKKQPLLALFLFLAFQSFAQKAPGDISVSVKNGAVNLGKKNNVSDDWSIQDGVAYLGNSARVRDGYNKTHTYDNMGVVLFESMVDKKPSGKISEMQVHFSMPEPNDVTPKTGFTGSLKIEKLTITSSTTLAALKNKLKGYTETESYLEHSHRLAKNGVYFYFQFDKTDMHLIKVSFGQDKRK